MTKQEKLDAIYEAIADKTLSDGCIYMINKYNEMSVFARCDDICEGTIVQYDEGSESYSVVNNYTIIGHPVRIGDVLDYYAINFSKIHTSGIDRISFFTDIISLFEQSRLPIDEQSEGCIDYVYSLTKE